MLASYREISSQPEAAFARELTIQHGIGVIPVSAFYQHPDATPSNHCIVRFCFAKKDSTLNAAVARLACV
jgi:methionine aminotransferase